MATQHANSPCCRGRINHFGKRRRQCGSCKRTWRIRVKQRGRRKKRVTPGLVVRTLIKRQLLIHQKRYGHISPSGWSRRFTKALLTTERGTNQRRLPAGPYALLGDGLYFKFKRMDWVMYALAVKPVKAQRAYFLDPVLLPGKEGYERWRKAIATIPEHIRKSVLAFVSDGFRGSKLVAREHGWIHQRCHFHLLMALIRRHGRRSYQLKSSRIRKKMLTTVSRLLTARDYKVLDRARGRAQGLLTHPLCPPWIRIQTVEFLRILADFRAYLNYPKLNLPTTTNAIESTGKLIRKATSTARTPESVLLRAKIFLRLRKSITCHRKVSTKLGQ